MTTRRYLIGGPPGSGKSSFALSVVENLKRSGKTAVALELDQWSDSYRAIRGEIKDEERNKRFSLDWPWKDVVDPLIGQFIVGTEDVILGDLPGPIGRANVYMLDRLVPHADGALVFGRDPDGLKQWTRLFRDDYGLPIVHEIMSVRKCEPLILQDMERRIDPQNRLVECMAYELLERTK